MADRAPACGVNTAAPSMVSGARGSERRVARHRAQSAWPIAYQASDAARSFLRSSPPTQPASSGAPKHTSAAATANS